MARVESDADSGSTSSGGDSGGDEHSSLEHKLASSHHHSPSLSPSNVTTRVSLRLGNRPTDHSHIDRSSTQFTPIVVSFQDESITSSESESETEDDATLEQSVIEAETKITKNPYVYTDHVQLLTFLQSVTLPHPTPTHPPAHPPYFETSLIILACQSSMYRLQFAPSSPGAVSITLQDWKGETPLGRGHFVDMLFWKVSHDWTIRFHTDHRTFGKKNSPTFLL